MLLVLQPQLKGLGADIIPVIYDAKTNKFAQPNTSLAHKGEVPWKCSDWMIFHKKLVEAFMAGRFASKIKYTKEKAIELSNQIYRQHWERNATFFSSLRTCGYGSEFYSYFTSVGLADIINLLQKAANVTTKTAENTITAAGKITNTVTDTLVNTVDSAGNIVENVGEGANNLARIGKYLVPLAVGGVVVLVGAYAYKNYIQGNSRVRVGAAQI